MTVWSAEMVAGFGRDAGWRGDELVAAVAVALAGSRGDDAADTGAGFDGRPLHRGLWLVPLGELSSFSDGALFDPVNNAEAAYYLWDDMGGWAWNPAWTAGEWRWELDAALAGVKASLVASPPTNPWSDGRGMQGSVRRATDTLGLVAHRLAGAAIQLRSSTQRR